VDPDRADALPGRRPVAFSHFSSRGLRDAEIAQELGISARTVNRHVGTALQTTGTRNRVELTALALDTTSAR